MCCSRREIEYSAQSMRGLDLVVHVDSNQLEGDERLESKSLRYEGYRIIFTGTVQAAVHRRGMPSHGWHMVIQLHSHCRRLEYLLLNPPLATLHPLPHKREALSVSFVSFFC